MMMNNTLAQLRELKLQGMACAIEEQLSSSASTSLSFEERLALMVDREVHYRGDKRRAALLKKAGLKYPQACIEDVDGRAGRGFERSALMSLALSRWVEEGTAILISGATGSGKSWLACALAQYACRRGHSALYLRTPRLAEELRILHGNGGFARWLAAVARTEVLVLDDWGLAALDGPTRSDLLEVIDDRAGTRPTIVTSQLKCGAPHFNWNAERIIMRTVAPESPSLPLFPALFTPHNGAGGQRGDEFVGRTKTARPQVRRCGRIECFQLDGRVGSRVHLGRLYVGMAEPQRDLA